MTGAERQHGPRRARCNEFAIFILAAEHAAAGRIRSLFDQALDASLHEQGVAVR